MKDVKYRYLYCVCTTNPNSNLGNKVYFGCHRTNDLNDGYIGSGVLLQKYLKKYPNDYERYILEYFNTDEEMFNREYEIIHDVLKYPIVLNLTEGGKGGSVKGRFSEETKKAAYNKWKDSMQKYFNDKDWCKKTRGRKGNANAMYGHSAYEYMTPEKILLHKQHISEAAKDRRWITNGVDKKLVKLTETDKYIKMGYHFGRK